MSYNDLINAVNNFVDNDGKSTSNKSGNSKPIKVRPLNNVPKIKRKEVIINGTVCDYGICPHCEKLNALEDHGDECIYCGELIGWNVSVRDDQNNKSAEAFTLEIGESCGDCECDYEVLMSRELTVGEFVKAAVHRDLEWGRISIHDKDGKELKPNCCIDFNKGYQVDTNYYNSISERKVVKVEAYGGYSRMTYKVYSE